MARLCTCRKQRVRVGETLFYLGYALYAFFGTCSSSMLSEMGPTGTLSSVGKYAGVAIMLARFLFLTRTPVYRVFAVLASTLLGFMIYLNMDAVLPITIAVVVFSAFQCNEKTIAKIFLIAVGSVLALSTALSYAGVLRDVVQIRSTNGVVRHSLGMNYVTVWAGFVSMLVVAYLYYRDRITPAEGFLILGLDLFLYVVTNARIQFLTILAILMLYYLRPIIRKFTKSGALAFLLKNSLLLSAVGSFLLQGLYASNPTRYERLDLLLTKRLSITQNTIEENGFHLLGKDFFMQGFGTKNFDWNIGYNFVDCAYINYALKYGVIFVALLCMVFTIICHKVYQRDTMWLLACFGIICLNGVLTSMIFLPNFEPFFVLLYANYSSLRNKNRGAG